MIGKERGSLRLCGNAVLALIMLLAPAIPVLADGYGTYPPPVTGDWSIEDMTYAGNMTLLLPGNITVGNGTLTLFNDTLVGNKTSSTFFIHVSENGTINAYNCTFRTGNCSDMVFRLRGNATFKNCKFEDPYSLIWIYRYTGNYTMEDSTLHGTFEVKNPLPAPIVRNCTVRDAYFGMMNPFPVSTVTFINCTLGLHAGSNNSVTNCTFKDCKKGLAAGQGTLVRDCTFDKCTEGDTSQLEGNTFAGANLQHCTFTNCTTGALLGMGGSLTDCDISGCTIGVDILANGNITDARFTGCTKGVNVQENGTLSLKDSNIDGGAAGANVSSAASIDISACTFNRPASGDATDASLVTSGVAAVHNSTFGGSTGKDIRVVSGNCTAINTTLRSGASEVQMGFLAVGWYLDCSVAYQNSTAAAFADVEILDRSGISMLQTVTDVAGSTGVLEAMEYRLVQAGASYRTPLTIYASQGLYGGNTTIDLNGNKHTSVTMADLSIPAIHITSPANGTLTNSTTVSLAGTASDFAGPVSAVTVRVDAGSWTPAVGTESWTASLTLTDGSHSIEAMAVDAAGNSAIASIRLTVDTIPPLLKVNSPAQGALFNSSNIVITGRVEPGATLIFEGNPVSAVDGNFTINLTLNEGPNDIVLTARDAAGNTNTTKLTVTLDTTPPALTLTAPADGTLTVNKKINITGTVEAGAKLTFGGNAISYNGTTYSIGWNLTEGLNTLTVYAEDAAGNRRNVTVKVTLDTLLPSLSVDIATGSSTNATSINITGSTERNATVTVNGAAVQVDSTGRYSASVALVLGQNNMTIEAKDAAGNTKTTVITITRVNVTVPPPPPKPKPPVDNQVPFTTFAAIGGVIGAVVVVAAVALVMRGRKKPGAGVQAPPGTPPLTTLPDGQTPPAALAPPAAQPQPAYGSAGQEAQYQPQAPAPTACPFCGAAVGPGDEKCLQCAAVIKRP